MDLSSTMAQQMRFGAQDIEQMHQAALRTLHELGLSVENQVALQALADAGVKIEGQRAYFEPGFITEHLEELQRIWKKRSRPRSEQLTIGVGDMCQYYHNPHNDQIELMTTANVIEATKSVEVMRKTGIGCYVPGVPRDVPPQLQAIMEYRIGAEFSSGGPTLDTLYPPEALNYLFEMADALGAPMRSTNIFSVSPLRLSGYEFDIAIKYKDRWQEFSVTTYPAAGVSAPIHFRAAWVLSIAEALGGAVTMHVVSGGKPVWICPGMFPFDLRTLTITGGMPECAWMYWARAQINRFYDPGAGYSMMLGTQAKRPGLQAGYEKATAGTLGVMTGCDDLHYAGVLSFDDIFSPSQLVADCELRDSLVQLRRGIPLDDPDQWIEVIREGLGKGYIQTDTTLNHYRDAYWFSNLFDRHSWHTYQEINGRDTEERASAEILSKLSSYQYTPPVHAITEVRRIFTQAWHALGGSPDAEFLRGLSND
jgi:trimethylamine--corrinoid protein Co-methyltransferase